MGLALRSKLPPLDIKSVIIVIIEKELDRVQTNHLRRESLWEYHLC